MKNSPTVLVASDDAFELATLSAALRLHAINVEAEAHAAETKSETDNFDFEILVFKSLISYVFSLYFGLLIGSCQIKSSFGTSGPK